MPAGGASSAPIGKVMVAVHISIKSILNMCIVIVLLTGLIRNQAVTGLPDTSYRMRVSEGKRMFQPRQLVLLLLVFVDQGLKVV